MAANGKVVLSELSFLLIFNLLEGFLCTLVNLELYDVDVVYIW